MAIPVLSRYGPPALELVMVEVSPPGRRPEDETHFGFSTVRLGQKQALVDDVFHKVADRYDLMNDFMSVGPAGRATSPSAWRRRAARRPR